MYARAGLVLLLCLIVLVIGCRHPAGPTSGATTTTSSLTGPRWILTHLGGSRIVEMPADARPYLRFVSAEGTLEGYGSCNGFSAPYRLNGTSVRLSGPAMSTKRACADPALNDQEQRFLSALGSMSRYSLNGDVLTLFSDSGVIARLERDMSDVERE